MMCVLWLALISTACLMTFEATPIPRQNKFLKLDAGLLERIEQTAAEITKNSTNELVENSTQSMIYLFIRNLNMSIAELEQTSNFQNNSNSDDTNIKEVVKKCLIMFENTIITIEYVSFKINVLSKSVEEFEQLEKYLLDEEKRLKETSDQSLVRKIREVLENIQITKNDITEHVNHLKEVNIVLKDLGTKMKNTLKINNNSTTSNLVSNFNKWTSFN